MNVRTILLLLLLPVLPLSACSDAGSHGAPLALGFTDFPSAKTAAAVADAWDVIRNDANMASLHFDDGVPWPQALAGAAYNSGYQAEISAKAAAVPAGHRIYLSTTPISFSRDSLAAYRGTNGGMPLQPPWDGYPFDHPDVVTAYINHCEKMIGEFDPDYFTYAIEANILAASDPATWPSFVSLAGQTYSALKTAHPGLPLIITLQADFFHAESTTQTALVAAILPFTDYIAVSTYAFTNGYTPATLPAGWFSDMAGLAADKPFAVGETSWPAQTLTSPYPVTIPATEQDQADYAARLLSDAEMLEAVFVNWFFTRDYDDFWDSDLQYLPDAPLLRIWKDTGFYDGQGNARSGLAVWRSRLG